MIQWFRHRSALAVAGLGIAAGAALHAASPSMPDSSTPGDLEVVAELEQPPGNVAITPEGRIIFSQHPFGAPEHAVVELLPDGRTRPFPSEAWSRPPRDGSMVGLNTVIGIESDRQGIVWMLDLGAESQPPKLVAWDSRADRLHRVIHIPRPVQEDNSFMQDLAIDPVREVIYIADMSRGDLVGESSPAIVVVDLKTGFSRRVLDGHPILQPVDGMEFVIDGTPLRINAPDGPAPRLGLNPITIDPASEYVYVGAMNGSTIVRLATRDLVDASLSDADLAARAVVVGPKPPCDGISIDGDGNVYITDVNRNAIGVLDAQGEYRVLVQDDMLSWPDGITFGPDGWGYVTVNQLHRHAVLNGGVATNAPPYRIVRFRPIGPAVPGR